MPIFTDDMDTHAIQGSNFGFSAKRIEDLGATEYTLVGIAADTSGSVEPFRDEIEKCVKEVVKSCRHSPRADNLMMRLTRFDDKVEEVHGFRPLSECNIDSYTGCIATGGMTALYDAACNLTDSVTTYGRSLSTNDFSVNGIIFVITDGMDNRSSMTPGEVKKALERAVQSEALESVVSILIGVNVTDPRVSQYLNDLHKSAGFTQYIELGNASANSLAKLADFVSRSISAQSQALGTGGPSQSLSF
jgi:hypothetical protein